MNREQRRKLHTSKCVICHGGFPDLDDFMVYDTGDKMHQTCYRKSMALARLAVRWQNIEKEQA